MSKHPIVILNPAARGGAGLQRWRDLEPLLGERFGHVEIRQTRAAGETTPMAREALESGTPLLVSAGGDGTHSEVVAAFFDEAVNRFPETRLGLLPLGTGNDLVRGLGLSGGPRAVLERLTLPARTTDVGYLTYTTPEGATQSRLFINSSSAGIGAEVVETAARLRLGAPSYLVATLTCLARGSRYPIELEVDGEVVPVDRPLLLAVCNGPVFGGGMRVAPPATTDDGLLDIVAIELDALRALRLMRAIYKGRHIGRRGIRCWRGREVTARPKDGAHVPLEVDGEQPGHLPATWRVLPGALQLVC